MNPQTLFSPREYDLIKPLINADATATRSSTLPSEVASTIFQLTKTLARETIDATGTVPSPNINRSEGGEEDLTLLGSSQTSLSGYLNRFPSKSRLFSTGWKRRFFNLHGTTLEYYKDSPSSREKPRRLTLSADFTISDSAMHPLAWEVCTLNVTLYLAADSLEDKIKWCAALSRAILCNRAHTKAFIPPSSAEIKNKSSSSTTTALAITIPTLDSLHLLPPTSAASSFSAMSALNAPSKTTNATADTPEEESARNRAASSHAAAEDSPPPSQKNANAEALREAIESGHPVRKGYLVKETTLTSDARAPWRRSQNKRYFVLKHQTLFYYRIEPDASLEARKRPLSSIFLDYTTSATKVANNNNNNNNTKPSSNGPPPPRLEIVTATRTFYLTAATSREADEWLEAIEASVRAVREWIVKLESAVFVKRRRSSGIPTNFTRPVSGTAVPPPPPPTSLPAESSEKQVVVDASPSPSSSPGETEIAVVPVTKPEEEQPSQPIVKEEEEKEEEIRDPRPSFEIRVSNGNDASPTTGRLIGSVHADLEDSMAALRTFIYAQIDPPTLVPFRLCFFRPPAEWSVELGKKATAASDAVVAAAPTPSPTSLVKLPQSLEGTTKVKECLVVSGEDVTATRTIYITGAEGVLNEEATGAGDWEAQKRAYEAEIRHLEAQLADARLALARALANAGSSGTAYSEAAASSSLFSALSTLQRDGYLDSQVSLPEMEAKYDTIFETGDVAKLLLSPASPFRVAFRRLCGEPERLRDFLETLQNKVLRPYRLRASRMSCPFWLRVLRDPAFIDNPASFEQWAKSEPWTEDDGERYVYLTSKLLRRGNFEDESEHEILKPRPTAPVGGGGGGGLKPAPAPDAGKSARFSANNRVASSIAADAAAAIRARSSKKLGGSDQQQ